MDDAHAIRMTGLGDAIIEACQYAERIGAPADPVAHWMVVLERLSLDDRFLDWFSWNRRRMNLPMTRSPLGRVGLNGSDLN